MTDRTRRARALGVVAATLAVALAVAVPARAATPIGTTSTTGVHVETVPALGTGTEQVVGGSDAGWVALTTGVWRGSGTGYPEAVVPPNENPNISVLAISDTNIVAGNYVATGSQRRAFVLRPDGTFLTLPSPPGDSGVIDIVPVAISDDGAVVGTFQAFADTCRTTAAACGFLATPDPGGESYSVETFTTPEGLPFLPTAIGGTGGDVIVAGGGRTWTRAGGYQDLQGVVAGRNGTARSINASSSLVGTVSPQDGVVQAAYWPNPTSAPIVIPTVGSDVYGFARDLNESNQVVGWSGASSSPTGARHAFVWDATDGTRDLGTLPGGTSAEAMAITEDGLVIGESNDRPVVWDLDDDFVLDQPPDVGIASLPPRNVEAGDPVVIELVVNDLEGDPYEFVIDGLPGGSYDDTTDTFRWDTGVDDAGTYSFSFTVRQIDAPANAYVLPVSLPLTVHPALTLAPIGDQTVEPGQELAIDPVVDDAGVGGPDGVTFIATGGTSEAPTALPEGATIDGTSGAFRWTPTPDQVGTHTVSIEATDTTDAGFARSAVETFDIVVDADGVVEIVVSETVIVSDEVSLVPAVQITIDEAIVVTNEVVFDVPPSPITITINEAVTVTDEVDVAPSVLLVIDETITISDDVIVDAPPPTITISVSEQIVVSDDVLVRPSVFLRIEETVAVADDVAVAPSVLIRFGEPVAISDEVTTQTEAVDLDRDGDGILDVIDGRRVGGAFVSDASTFSDDFTDQHRSGKTYGTIIERGVLDPGVADVSSDGVRVTTGPGVSTDRADLDLCDLPGRVRVLPKSSVVFRCGSLFATVETGGVEIEFPDGGVLAVDAGGSVVVRDDGTTIEIEVFAGPARLLDGDAVDDLAAGDVVVRPEEMPPDETTLEGTPVDDERLGAPATRTPAPARAVVPATPGVSLARTGPALPIGTTVLAAMSCIVLGVTLRLAARRHPAPARSQTGSGRVRAARDHRAPTGPSGS